MIGVAQHERSVDLLELCGRERLDRCLGAHGRKDRRDEVAVRRGENSSTSTVVACCDGEFEHEEDCKRELGDSGDLSSAVRI